MFGVQKVHTLSDRTVPATLLKTSAIDIELSDSPPSLVCKLKGIGIFCPDPTKRIISSRNESVRLEGATFELCKGGIAGLGDSRAHISQDPDAAREALSMSKGEHTRDRVCSLAAHSALGAQLLDTLHAQLSAQKTLAQESDMRDGLLNSLRQIRAQYTDVSRKLRNALVVNCSLTAELEKERAARVTAESALANLASKNLTLIEHNKVLLGREPTLPNDSFISHRRSHLATDSHLQVAIPARMAIPMSHSRQSSISEAYQPQAFLAEPSLRQLEGSSASGLICWTTEFRRAALRTKLIAAENELHIAKQHLAISERRCDTLSTKVSSLQANLTICVDECSRALAVERELRYEVEARVHDLWCKAQSFEDQGRDLETEADCKPFPVKAWRQTGGYVRQMNAISMAAFDRCDALERDNLKQNDIIAELSKKIADHENLVKGVDILGQDIARYKGTIAELETRVRERFEDRYYRLKARKVRQSLRTFEHADLPILCPETHAVKAEEKGIQG